jgi:hypothetical protein
MRGTVSKRIRSLSYRSMVGKPEVEYVYRKVSKVGYARIIVMLSPRCSRYVYQRDKRRYKNHESIYNA